MAAREKWGYESERLVFYNLEENSAVATVRDRLQLEGARAKVEDVANQIAAGNFDPTPGYHCRFCSYRNLCPATEKPLHSAPPKQPRCQQLIRVSHQKLWGTLLASPICLFKANF